MLVLAAGLLLRFLVVYSDRRRSMPGEERYYARLAQGNEHFLKGFKRVSGDVSADTNLFPSQEGSV